MKNYEEALRLINEHNRKVNGDSSGVDIFGPGLIQLGFHETEEHRVVIVFANLIDCQIELFVDDLFCCAIQYEDLREMVEHCLSRIDIETLAAISEAHLDQLYDPRDTVEDAAGNDDWADSEENRKNFESLFVF